MTIRCSHESTPTNYLQFNHLIMSNPLFVLYLLLCALFILISNDISVIGSPLDRQHSSAVNENFIITAHNYGDCVAASELQSICEKCSKVTKSVMAYPMCCDAVSDARLWCKKFLEYTFNEQ